MRSLARWVRREPVRVWLYGVLLGAEGVALTYGVLTKEQAMAWLGLGAAVLGVPLVEKIRSLVSPAGQAGVK